MVKKDFCENSCHIEVEQEFKNAMYMYWMVKWQTGYDNKFFVSSNLKKKILFINFPIVIYCIFQPELQLI
jgi:hypothetical protein